MSKPKVAIDARLTRQMSVGMQAYARELSARLPQVAGDLEFAIFRDGSNFSVQEQVFMPLAMRAAKANLSHFLSQYTPLFPPRPYIITIHDLIHLRFPQYFKAKVGPYYQTAVRFATGRAARIITDDERTVSDLHGLLGVDPSGIRVVALGADDVFFGEIEPFRPPRPYIIYAGNHRPHKDLPTLFAAWAGIPSDVALDLYVTGVDDFGGLHLEYTRTEGRIIAVGNVSEMQLASYYAGASALVHPALCEGFGLPMLEAMVVGCPVIACEDAIPAVLRDAALTFPARDVKAARNALESVLRNEGLRRALVNQAQEKARPYTWDRCARETAGVYREVLEEQSRQ